MYKYKLNNSYTVYVNWSYAQFASTDCPFRMNGAGSSVEAV